MDCALMLKRFSGLRLYENLVSRQLIQGFLARCRAIETREPVNPGIQ